MELDTSKDGFLSVDEIKDGMKKIEQDFQVSFGKNENYKPDWDKLIKCIDVNNDGQIGFDEFVTAATDRYRLIMGEGHLRQAFDILDIDHNGKISIEELKVCFSYGNFGAGHNTEKSERVDDDLWEELMTDIDKNGDGEIDFEEFS